MPDSPRAAAIEAAASKMREAHDAHEAGWKTIAAIAFEHADESLEIVGKKEAAGLFGKNPNNLVRDVPELPAPDWTLRATPVWRRDKLQAILDARAARSQETDRG